MFRRSRATDKAHSTAGIIYLSELWRGSVLANPHGQSNLLLMIFLRRFYTEIEKRNNKRQPTGCSIDFQARFCFVREKTHIFVATEKRGESSERISQMYIARVSLCLFLLTNTITQALVSQASSRTFFMLICCFGVSVLHNSLPELWMFWERQSINQMARRRKHEFMFTSFFGGGGRTCPPSPTMFINSARLGLSSLISFEAGWSGETRGVHSYSTANLIFWLFTYTILNGN